MGFWQYASVVGVSLSLSLSQLLSLNRFFLLSSIHRPPSVLFKRITDLRKLTTSQSTTTSTALLASCRKNCRSLICIIPLLSFFSFLSFCLCLSPSLSLLFTCICFLAQGHSLYGSLPLVIHTHAYIRCACLPVIRLP